MLANPADKTIAVGWDAVRARWDDTFHRLTEIQTTQVDGPYVIEKGDVAWSMGLVNVANTFASGEKKQFQFIETDVFEKRGDRWLLVSHVARPITP